MDIVDFHSHILPGADHGSSSVETSLGQLRLASSSGVQRIVATPHFYPHRDSVERFILRRSKCFDDLRAHMTDDCPSIRLGAEVLVCNNINNLPGLEQLCIAGSRILLLELPFNDFSYHYVDTVEQIIRDGYRVVLAHADRYPEENIEKMLYCGAKIQLNADSLATLLKKKHLYRWMERGKVVALGSDIHGDDAAAYKKFVVAQKKMGEYLPLIKSASDEMWSEFK